MKRRMRKMLGVFLAIVMTMALCSCGKKSDNEKY